MSVFRPRYITFDCYGTLTHFNIAGATRRIYAPVVSDDTLDRFLINFSAFRMDEVLGNWKPYYDVIANALERTCLAHGVEFRAHDAQSIYRKIPTWGPHPDVPESLARIAQEIPLVILSNAMNDQILSNVEKLGAPFYRVITAEETGAYKPQMKGFEYMLDVLGCGPQDITHVSSSFRYDLMTAHDMGIQSKVWVNRGHEPANSYYGYSEIADISGLPGVFGLN